MFIKYLDRDAPDHPRLLNLVYCREFFIRKRFCKKERKDEWQFLVDMGVSRDDHIRELCVRDTEAEVLEILEALSAGIDAEEKVLDLT